MQYHDSRTRRRSARACARLAHRRTIVGVVFFLYHTATTEIYTLSLHDALPTSRGPSSRPSPPRASRRRAIGAASRSEEHTSELQSHHDLVCRLLLEKKKDRR